MRSHRFLAGTLTGILLALVVGLLALPFSGLVDMSASSGPGPLDEWGDLALDSSLRWRAPDAQVPKDADLAEGFEHYKSSCVLCHGAPGVDPASWSEHLLPEAPKLWEPDSQEMSDGELFRVVKGGVRMTAMPAFGADHSDADIWNMVALVRGLDHLTPEQTKALNDVVHSLVHHEGGGPSHPLPLSSRH